MSGNGVTLGVCVGEGAGRGGVYLQKKKKKGGGGLGHRIKDIPFYCHRKIIRNLKV